MPHCHTYTVTLPSQTPPPSSFHHMITDKHTKPVGKFLVPDLGNIVDYGPVPMQESTILPAQGLRIGPLIMFLGYLSKTPSLHYDYSHNKKFART